MRNFAINFERGAYGADPYAGHVGKVIDYYDGGSSWIVTVRHSNWGSAATMTECGCTNVSQKVFVISKGDSRVHYIYDPRRVPPGPYKQDHSGGDSAVSIVTSAEYLAEANTTTIESTDSEVTRTIKPGRPVRIISPAREGTVLWVFVLGSRFPDKTFAITGSDRSLVEVGDPSVEPEGLSFATNYSDEALDLGFTDFTRLAGSDGIVTITIAAGATANEATPLQTIRLEYRK